MKRTARERAEALDAWSVDDLSLRKIVFGSRGADFGVDGDRPADWEEADFFPCRLSTGRSDCQSIPCCFLS
jgi:hypothetical protein